VPLSPTLRAQTTYPFVRLNEAAAARRARGLEVIDFGMGDPREPTDPAILQALRDGVRERMGYPAAPGLPELREAIAAWVGRRYGMHLDPDRHVIPTLGSKEAIFSLAQVVLDVDGGRDTVVVTEPGYPVPARGAAFAGARVLELPLLERSGFLPELENGLQVKLEKGLVGLAVLHRRVLRCDLLEPVQGEEDLHLQRLLAPQGAIVVEGRNALGGWNVVTPAPLRYARNEIENGGPGRAVVPHGERIGRHTSRIFRRPKLGRHYTLV